VVVLPVTYTKPATVDLVMEAETSGLAHPRVGMKIHLMEGNPEARGHTEVNQLLKDQTDLLALTIRAIQVIRVRVTVVEAETASEVRI
jgi:hypothetical protein